MAITVEMIEVIDEGEGEGNQPTLLFTFGPSGAYFEPPLALVLSGGYIDDMAMLYDEDGEALEYTVDEDGDEDSVTGA